MQNATWLAILCAGALLTPRVLAQSTSPSKTNSSTPRAGGPNLFRDLYARRRGPSAPVPPRALAVIPERHTGRMIRMVDVLVAIDPQFDDVAVGAGLNGRRAIQLRTRDARVPVFVEKSESAIATLLQVPIGARLLITGMLIPRGSRYLFLATDVRPSPRKPRRSRSGR